MSHAFGRYLSLRCGGGARAALVGGRIDKIYQPGRDEVVLAIRGNGGNVRLLLSASPNQPRAQLTALSRENPGTPPMFCMLLRKHLTGGRILEIVQPPMERLLDFRLETVDELGDKVERRLILECMGRRANLILLDGAGRIVDCLRRVDGDLAANRRQVLPGMFYRLPPAPDKQDPLACPEEELHAALRNPLGKSLDKLLLDTFTGISPLIARELAFRAGEDPAALGTELDKLLETVRDKRFAPYLLVRRESRWTSPSCPSCNMGRRLSAAGRRVFPPFWMASTRSGIRPSGCASGGRT